MLQRSHSTGKYIDKQTLRTKVYRGQNTGGWGFTVAGGMCSPYGDLPIHILDMEHCTVTGRNSLKKGDEIVSFGGENFENVTFLEADRKIKNIEGNCATVIVKRKYLHRKKTQICNTFADAWNEQAKESRRIRHRPESFYY
jgi:C-terminal processing protease CtpA/Prc